jgi:hypothetical protein
MLTRPADGAFQQVPPGRNPPASCHHVA